MSDKAIADLGNKYHEWLRKHPHCETDFANTIEDLLNDAGITFDRVQTRIKTWPSLKEKARKKNSDGTYVYPDPWNSIHDIIGIRVITYNSTEIPRAIEALSRSFTMLRSVDKAAETRVSGDFGYGSHHLILKVDEHTEGLEDYDREIAEVQIRTILQHAWAEFEHDIRYKRGTKDLDPQVDRAFTLAAGLIELADQQFDKIAALRSPEIAPADDVELIQETLPGILTILLGARYPLSRSDHYHWLFQLLNANGLTTVAELKELVDENDISRLRSKIEYRYKPGQVRIIDDLLLLRFGTEHIERTKKLGHSAERRAKRLKQRLRALGKESRKPLS
ncbi:GTP pyrophosphokinase [Corynebacterium caspium]|uniref:GTP pyrophosphokinase n=1 Tax=Corynebacterium caspium TaxID=234828 RepID=UPI00037834CD|nr:hypothetical protein [Corynebacterium caspium]WKD59023.1 GTP pyrophosphokinase YwaC [Corynebacterium caspium DSM 44850]